MGHLFEICQFKPYKIEPSNMESEGIFHCSNQFRQNQNKPSIERKLTIKASFQEKLMRFQAKFDPQGI